jgi:ATP-dependent phosphoenolpyruvate carboxykinase
MPYSIRYCFSQHFAVSAQDAYNWCTDFQPEDHALMGEKNAKREIRWLTVSTVLLKETFHTGKGDVEKEKLVQLYPDRFRWVSTHISGANKYSQFIYEIIAEAEDSRLDFTALHIEHQEHLSKNDLKTLEDKLFCYDSGVWKSLAKVMKTELTANR